MICKNENCEIEYNIPYGSGEFCSSRCATIQNQTSEMKENLQQKTADNTMPAKVKDDEKSVSKDEKK